jgi:starch-binding outer membrane protein, SusD/RagB family
MLTFNNYHMKSKIKTQRYLFFPLAGIMLLGMVCIIPSCRKYLDVTPENVGTIDYAFRNRNEAENYLFACYGTLQALNNPVNDPGFVTSGEVYNQSAANNLKIDNFTLLSGSQNTTSPLLNYWEGTNSGVNLFQAIRRCNIFLKNIDKAIDLSASEKERWVAEANFLKAYYHYYLLRMYGPIPIMDEEEDISLPVETFRKKRQPVDSVFAYIVGLLDKAIPGLPPSIVNINDELGRITQTIALAEKAEVLATQASPLFNGNPDYAGFLDKDGTPLFPAAADNEKWQRAAVACKAAISQARDLNLKLYSFIIPPAISKLNDSLKLVLSLQGAVTEKWSNNSELIWALNGMFGYQQNCVPRLTANTDVFSGVPGNLSVPLAVAELFYTKNGVPMEEDKSWDYANRFTMQTADRFDKYYIKEGYNTAKANFNREARYYASIAFDGGTWFGGGVLDQESMLYVGARKDGISGVQEYLRANVTGYWPKKLAHYQTAITSSGGLSVVGYRMPRMRLAGLYLLYAECLNEAGGPSNEVYSYIDSVRSRAKLKGVVESWASYSNMPGKPLTKDGLRDIIHREKRIELCFEGQTGWDLRRWKEYVTEASKPVQGWNVMQADIKSYYTLQTLMVPVISTKDYLWPLSGNELLKNNKLVQAPYWR